MNPDTGLPGSQEGLQAPPPKDLWLHSVAIARWSARERHHCQDEVHGALGWCAMM